jgi:hypothetical protein
MGFSINLPGLLRLAVLKKPAEIRAMNAAEGIDRALSGQGGSLNRSIISKLQPFRTPDGRLWPAFSSRSDPVRAKYQGELEARLSNLQASLQGISGQIAELAAFVVDKPGARPAGIVVQEAVGRLFFPDYRANDNSYAAAKTLSEWLAAGPVKTLRMRLAGQPQAAIGEVTQQARGDLACAHATGIAMHNIVESLTQMQELARSGNALKQLSPSEAVTRTLRGPQRVVREAQTDVQAAGSRIPAHALVLLSVEDARKDGSDPGIVFFTGQWNQCPAHSLVPALLAEVWRTAIAK